MTGRFFVFANLPLFANGIPDLPCAMRMLPVLLIKGNTFGLSLFGPVLVLSTLLLWSSKSLFGVAVSIWDWIS